MVEITQRSIKVKCSTLKSINIPTKTNSKIIQSSLK